MFKEVFHMCHQKVARHTGFTALAKGIVAVLHSELSIVSVGLVVCGSDNTLQYVVVVVLYK